MVLELTPERDVLMAHLQEASTRVETLIHSLDESDVDKPVSGLTWTAGETAVHLVVIARRCYMDMRRSSEPAGTAALNTQTIAEIDVRDPAKLARMFRNDMKIALERVFPKMPDDLEFPFHAGTKTSIRPAMAVVLGELLIHGKDIADATGTPWAISDEVARLVWLGVMDVAYGWLKRDILPETYRIHFKNYDTPVLLTIDERKTNLQKANENTAADHILHVEPLEFLLQFPYMRQKSDDPVIEGLSAKFHPI